MWRLDSSPVLQINQKKSLNASNHSSTFTVINISARCLCSQVQEEARAALTLALFGINNNRLFSLQLLVETCKIQNESIWTDGKYPKKTQSKKNHSFCSVEGLEMWLYAVFTVRQHAFIIKVNNKRTKSKLTDGTSELTIKAVNLISSSELLCLF